MIDRSVTLAICSGFEARRNSLGADVLGSASAV